ncbi:UNVERIFIED_CONTAM: hypothetical protein Sradi_0421600 [Sesamum radiatum]|uniref:Cysteine proteinase inhibitor n=1 Tax=Sesamum radiatum TaxID=300843 RepID=A0AAW2W6B8_SESRA
MVKPGGPIPVERTLLAFKKVLSAERQLVKGYNYYLTLEAANELEKVHLYEATVFVSGENNFKELTEFKIFKPAPGGPIPIEVTPKLALEIQLVLIGVECIGAGGGWVQLLSSVGSCGWRKNNVYEAKVYVSFKDVKELEDFKLVGPAA